LDRDNINRLKKIVDRLSTEDGKYLCTVIYSDPITKLYSILLILYIFILGAFLLWPFNFVSLIKNDARWIENSAGIEFLRVGQAVSKSSTQELFDRLVKGSGLTLEVWLKTEDLSQTGPARILSYSINPVLRNFTLGQWRDKLVFRLRTVKTNLNGTNPHLTIDDTFNDKDLKHIVIMYDFSEQRVYINGEQKAKSDILKGSFSNWDRSCKLVIGNEVTGNRPWKGKIYYAAVYDRPLREKEIQQNYLSGLHHKKNIESTDFNIKGPVVRYLFSEGKEDVIHDSGSVSPYLNLFLPKNIKLKPEPFLNMSFGSLHDAKTFSDIVINILIFIPLGMLVHGKLRTRFEPSKMVSLSALLIGTLFSLGVESAQYYLMTRHSSLLDVATNMTGTAIGIVIDRFYSLYLNYQTKHLWTQINTPVRFAEPSGQADCQDFKPFNSEP